MLVLKYEVIHTLPRLTFTSMILRLSILARNHTLEGYALGYKVTHITHVLNTTTITTIKRTNKPLSFSFLAHEDMGVYSP